MTAVATLPDYELSYEDGSGGILSVNVLGHHDDETALAVAREALLEYEGAVPKLPFEDPVRCFLRMVPGTDEDGARWLRHVYKDTGGRGARAVTRVDLGHYWPYRCWVCGARAQTGLVPESHYLETEGYLPPQPDPDSRADHAWLCRAHMRALEEHVNAVRACVHLPCPDCGHALGAHQRYEHGAHYPCSFAWQNPCACAHLSPHTAVVTLDDLRAATTEGPTP